MGYYLTEDKNDGWWRLQGKNVGAMVRLERGKVEQVDGPAQWAMGLTLDGVRHVCGKLEWNATKDPE